MYYVTRRVIGGRNFARGFSDPLYAQAMRTTGAFVFFAVLDQPFEPLFDRVVRNAAIF